MKARDIVLIFTAVVSVIASTFIYKLKDIEKKYIESSKKSSSAIKKADKATQLESRIVLLKRDKDNVYISDSKVLEPLLVDEIIEIAIEQEGEEERVEVHREEPTPEYIVAKQEAEISGETTVEKEIKKEKQKRDIEETTSTDDVDAHIEEIISDREGVLRDERIPEWFKESIRGLNYIKEHYGIDMGMAYRGVAQYEGVSDSFGGGGNFDIFGRYKAAKGSTIGFNVRSRHTYGPYTSSDYADNIGSLYALSPSYEKLPIFITELWYQYMMESFTVRLGFVNRNSFIDNSFYKNQNRYFLSSTFSLAQYNSLPDNGLGVVLRYKKPDYYALAYLADSDVKKGESLGNILDRDMELYGALEFGLTPEDGKYYITLWNRNSEDRTKDKNSGAIFSANKMFDNEYKVFAKYAFSEKSTEKEHFELGFGRKNLYRVDDLISMVFSVSRPSEDFRTQSATELFYRYDFYYGMQLTTSMQIIHHPSKSQEDWALLPGVRVRMIF